MVSYRPSRFIYKSSDLKLEVGSRSGKKTYRLKDGDRIIVYPVACSSKGHPPSKQKMKHFGKYGVIEGHRSYGSWGIPKLKVRFEDGSLGYPDLNDILPLKKSSVKT